MQKIPSHRIQGMLVGAAVLVTMILLTACSGVGSTTTQSTPTTGTTGTTATTTSSSPVVSPTATQPAGPTATSVPFKPGGVISFIGPVNTVNSTSLVMTAPNGQKYTLAIAATTDLSAYNGVLPTVGSSVNMDAAVNPDGSFTATVLKPGVAGDPDTNIIAYTGTTTSAVGADRMIHFTVGTRAYTYTIPTTAVLTDFGGNAQAIGINVLVKVKVLYPANTVSSIGMG